VSDDTTNANADPGPAANSSAKLLVAPNDPRLGVFKAQLLAALDRKRRREAAERDDIEAQR
jgi:hypothetical protein